MCFFCPCVRLCHYSICWFVIKLASKKCHFKCTNKQSHTSYAYKSFVSFKLLSASIYCFPYFFHSFQHTHTHNLTITYTFRCVHRILWQFPFQVPLVTIELRVVFQVMLVLFIFVRICFDQRIRNIKNNTQLSLCIKAILNGVRACVSFYCFVCFIECIFFWFICKLCNNFKSMLSMYVYSLTLVELEVVFDSLSLSTSFSSFILFCSTAMSKQQIRLRTTETQVNWNTFVNLVQWKY